MHIKIKQLNNVIKSTLISLFGLLLVAGFVTSCSFNLSQSVKSSTKTTTVSFSLDKTARNILPVVDKDNDLLITKITYKKANAAAVEIMANEDGKKISQLETYEDIPAGERLTFEATAKIGQLVYEAVTVETLRAGVTNSVTLKFVLAETNDNYVAQTNEKGNISIGIKVIDDNVTTVKAKLTKYNGTVVEENVNIALSNRLGIYVKNEVLAGTYKIALTLYNGSLKLGEHTALINVVKDKTSSPVSPLELDGNDIYSITYKNFKTELLQEGTVLQTSCTRFSEIALPGAAVISKDSLKTFGGWYDNKELVGNPVTQLSDVRDNVILYAKWIKVPLENAKLSFSGILKTGETLTADYKNAEGATDTAVLSNVTYQWYRDGDAITGATANTYPLVEEDGNATISLVITANTDSECDYEGTATFVAATAVQSSGPDYSRCAVGDFILKDGSVLSKTTDLTAEQKSNIAAVIVRAAAEGKPALGVGIVLNKSGLKWCVSTASAYTTLITDLVGSKDDRYMDGRNSWEILKTNCSDASDANTNPYIYPAWNFCLTYGATNDLAGAMAEGWYLPTMAELYTIYLNREAVDASLEKAGVSQFGDSGVYWSCCQGTGYAQKVRCLDFKDEDPSSYDADGTNKFVCSVKVFE